MKIKILLVEDEILVAEDIADDLRDEGFEITDIVVSGEETIDSIEQKTPDLVLMDINIRGKLDGIETAQVINESYQIPIIYVTANTSNQFVNRALQTAPHAFLSKPFNQKDLNVAIELAIQRHNNSVLANRSVPIDLGAVFLKSGDAHIKVKIEDITMIHACGSYSTVHTNKKKYTLSLNLHNFEKKLKVGVLKRVHRSYIVNLKHVNRIENNLLYVGKEQIPVSNAYREEVNRYFKKV